MERESGHVDPAGRARNQVHIASGFPAPSRFELIRHPLTGEDEVAFLGLMVRHNGVICAPGVHECGQLVGQLQ